MLEISRRRSTITSSTELTSTRLKSGRLSFKWPEVSRLFTTSTSFIETLSVLTFSAHQVESSNWGIWTYQKWPREAWQEHGLELLTIQVPRSGTTGLMIPNAIFGLLVVSSMKWPPSGILSEPITWNSCMPRFRRASTSLSPGFTLMIWDK